VNFAKGHRLSPDGIVSRNVEAEEIKKIVNAPEGYEFICLLTIGYPAERAFLPNQKEIDINKKIHLNKF